MASRKLVFSKLCNLVRGSTKVWCQQPRSTLQQHKRCLSLASQAYQRYFTREHEWVDINIEGNVGTIGITDHAQGLLGELVYVELPEVGDSFERDDPVGTVESVKAASDVMTPVGGTITSVNEELTKEPSLINKHPESEAWVFKIELSDASELDELMNATEYKEFVESES